MQGGFVSCCLLIVDRIGSTCFLWYFDFLGLFSWNRHSSHVVVPYTRCMSELFGRPLKMHVPTSLRRIKLVSHVCFREGALIKPQNLQSQQLVTELWRPKLLMPQAEGAVTQQLQMLREKMLIRKPSWLIMVDRG